MPLLARTIMSVSGVPFGLLTLVAVFTVTMMRAVSDTRAKQVPPNSFAALHHFNSF